jgi:cyanoexosortase A
MLRNLWVMLAALMALSHIAMVHRTQENTELTLMSLLVWGGALLCLEDRLPSLAPAPSWRSFGLGTLLVAVSLWSTASVLHLDRAAHMLPVWMGIGLTLICLPLRQIGRWSSSLMALALLPISTFIIYFPPVEKPLSLLTARLSQTALLLSGVDASVSGRTVRLAGGAVDVAGECNGIELISQLLVIATLFTLAFPLPKATSRWIPFAIAPLLAIQFNIVRIAVLALINTSQMPNRAWWFDFIHKEAGSLVFAGFAVCLFSWIYLMLLERQLSIRNS